MDLVNNMSASLCKRLQRSQNNHLRIAFDLRQDEQLTPYYTISKILKIADQIKIKIHFINSFNTKIPKYFSNKFEFVS